MTHEHVCWFQYVDDTFVIWPHSREKLTISEPPPWIPHEYSVHNGKRRRPPIIFGYWQLQETRSLPRSQNLSEAHPYQSTSMLGFTSPPCKWTISPGFPDTQSRSSLWPGFPHSRTGIFHHCFQGTWIQPPADMTSPQTCNMERLDQHKDALGLRMPGVHSIPCECSKVYNGWSSWSIQIRIKEHNRHVWLAHTDRAAVVEHSINQDHIIMYTWLVPHLYKINGMWNKWMKLQDTKILSAKSGYMDQLIR